MTNPSFRKLKGYAFDPSLALGNNRLQKNELLYKIRWEDTLPGPQGDYLDVIDFDPTRECLYEPVNLEDKFVLADHGLPLSEGDPGFHQQQVYAVAMSVIGDFEKVLGRKITWSRLTNSNSESGNEYNHEFVQRLLVYPHSLLMQNAYYSPAKLALLFGYFQSQEKNNGINVPGSAVFTCLCPDMITHEITHAIVDSIHPYLRKNTNFDLTAFHEGFADIIALLRRFSFVNIVEEQIIQTREENISAVNLFGDLALQFGMATPSNRKALRSLLIEKNNKGNWQLIKPDPGRYQRETQPHRRGAILVASIYNAYLRLYQSNVADLIRVVSTSSRTNGHIEIQPELAKRLAAEASNLANKLMMICIRALDYCPPADLNFSDYLRAIMTADFFENPDDEERIRYALLDGFRSWGIVPSHVKTWSVESLMWKPYTEYFEDEKQASELQKIVHNIFDPGESTANKPSGKLNPGQETTHNKNGHQEVTQRVGQQLTQQVKWQSHQDIDFLTRNRAFQVKGTQKKMSRDTEIENQVRRESRVEDEVVSASAQQSLLKILRAENRQTIFNESISLSASIQHALIRNNENMNNIDIDKLSDINYSNQTKSIGNGKNLHVEQLLGLCFEDISYSLTDNSTGAPETIIAPARRKFQVYSCRPVMHINKQTGVHSKILIITFLQKVFIDLRNSTYEEYFTNGEYEFCGGTTLIIDLTTFDIRFSIVKNIASSARLKQQLNYAADRSAMADLDLLKTDDEPFATIHKH